MNEEKILNLLQKKRGFFEAILELTEAEEALPLKQWVSVLEQKKVLLSCIDEIDKQLTSFKDSMHRVSQAVDSELLKITDTVRLILDIDTLNQHRRKEELRRLE